MIKEINKIFFLAIMGLLLVSCESEKHEMTKWEREMLEKEAEQKWQQAQDKMVGDGYGRKVEDGEIIWQRNVVKKKFKILNKDQLNRGRNKKKKPVEPDNMDTDNSDLYK